MVTLQYKISTVVSEEKKYIQLLEYATDFIIIRSGGSIVSFLWIHFVKARILKRGAFPWWSSSLYSILPHAEFGPNDSFESVYDKLNIFRDRLSDTVEDLGETSVEIIHG